MRAEVLPGKQTLIIRKSLSARDGIQTIHTYLNTHLPFAYVHLITLLVNLNNLVMSIKCGVHGAKGIQRNQPQDVLANALMAMVVPILYHGLLSISYVIHDPFDEDMLDFPIAAYTEYVAQCCDAGIVAADTYPGMALDDDTFRERPQAHVDTFAAGTSRHAFLSQHIKKDVRKALSPAVQPAFPRVVRALARLSKQLSKLHKAMILYATRPHVLRSSKGVKSGIGQPLKPFKQTRRAAAKDGKDNGMALEAAERAFSSLFARAFEYYLAVHLFCALPERPRGASRVVDVFAAEVNAPPDANLCPRGFLAQERVFAVFSPSADSP